MEEKQYVDVRFFIPFELHPYSAARSNLRKWIEGRIAVDEASKGANVWLQQSQLCVEGRPPLNKVPTLPKQSDLVVVEMLDSDKDLHMNDRISINEHQVWSQLGVDFHLTLLRSAVHGVLLSTKGKKDILLIINVAQDPGDSDIACENLQAELRKDHNFTGKLAIYIITIVRDAKKFSHVKNRVEDHFVDEWMNNELKLLDENGQNLVFAKDPPTLTREEMAMVPNVDEAMGKVTALQFEILQVDQGGHLKVPVEVITKWQGYAEYIEDFKTLMKNHSLYCDMLTNIGNEDSATAGHTEEHGNGQRKEDEKPVQPAVGKDVGNCFPSLESFHKEVTCKQGIESEVSGIALLGPEGPHAGQKWLHNKTGKTITIAKKSVIGSYGAGDYVPLNMDNDKYVKFEFPHGDKSMVLQESMQNKEKYAVKTLYAALRDWQKETGAVGFTMSFMKNVDHAIDPHTKRDTFKLTPGSPMMFVPSEITDTGTKSNFFGKDLKAGLMPNDFVESVFRLRLVKGERKLYIVKVRKAYVITKKDLEIGLDLNVKRKTCTKHTSLLH